MKILLISSRFPRMFGGVSDYTYHLSKAMTRRGNSVYVLTTRDEIVGTDHDVTVLPVINHWRLIDLPRIMREIRRIDPDWVSLQYVPHMYSRYGVPISIAVLSFLLRIAGFKLITTFHEVAIYTYWLKPKYLLVAMLQRLVAFIIAICSVRIVVSIEFYKGMLTPFIGKINRIPVGSNVLPLELPDQDLVCLRGEIANDGEMVVSTFGSNPPQRRNDVLLRAVHHYLEKRTNPPVRLRFIGNFSKKSVDELKGLARDLCIEEVVDFTGHLNPEEIYRHMKTSDIFILLEVGEVRGRQDGGVSAKSTALAAALACGLPIIGNKGSLTDEFFVDGENILFLAQVTDRDLYDLIKNLAKDRSLRERLSRGAYRTYQEHFAWDVIARRYQDIMSIGRSEN